MPYFLENTEQFVLDPINQTGLRECQLGALWALKSHLTTASKDIASIISMPTGSGKSALMMAICFELKLRKILIVVPSKILRRQIANQFRTLEILKRIGCLPVELPDVSVFEVESRKSSREEWVEILENHDVLVAHPNSISPYYVHLFPVPNDLIDAVFIDEAHHEPSPTWQAINQFYSNSLRVFFTATPFRRDRKRMKGKLIYHYSIDKALDDGILRPVNFRGVDFGMQNPHEALMQTALEAFNQERVNYPNAAILIRTDQIEEAKALAELYNQAGFNIDLIHSQRSQNVNSQLIEAVKNGELDGLVCVGIASEGLDIPNLKIAVLHATPRSIPYTIQFLGRISRTPEDQEGPAILIANRDQVRGEVYRLYKSDVSWRRIIPQIIDEQMQRARHYRSSLARESDFQMPEINVFFSTLIYTTTADFTFQGEFSTRDGSPYEILHVEQQDIDSPIIIVTAHDKPLDWSSKKIFVEDFLDIHILYYSHESDLLFELTTSQEALTSFKENLIITPINIISHDRLYKTLSQFNQRDYIMVGMRNSAMRGAAHPSYKTVIGSEVQSTVRASDGRIFGVGHALLRFDEENTWGLATKHGRVWAMKRGNAEEFKNWCDQLTTLITNGPNITSLPGLSFLATTTPVNHLDNLPIAVVPDDMFFRAHSTVIEVEGLGQIRNCIPTITPVDLDEVANILNCTLRIGDFECPLRMNFQNENLWTVDAAEQITVYAERYEHPIIEKSLQEVLNLHPSSLVMLNGDVIEGRNKITPNRSIEVIPQDIWIATDWNNCNIMAERYVENPVGPLPVINKTVDLISPNFSHGNDILFLDDGGHEIADLIWMDTVNKTVHFIHCKASTEENAGCRKPDCDVLFAQALRSVHWVFSNTLMDRIRYRLDKVGKSVIVTDFGTRELLNQISDTYQINDWHYNIVLVQPGFRIDQTSDRERANNNVYELTIPMYERIIGSGAKLEIWGT